MEKCAVPAATDEEPASSRRFDRRLWILFLGRWTTSMGHSISFPFFAIYFHTVLGVSMTAIGTIIFVSGLMGAFGKFFGGTLADRFGRKKVMCCALLGRSIATIGMGYLAFQPDPQWMPMAGLFIAGTWFGFLFDPACHAMVADLSDPRLRIQGYSLLRIGGNLGFAIGGVVGGLIGAQSFSAMFFTTSGVTFLAFLLMTVFVAESMSFSPLRPSMGLDLSCLRTPGFLVLCLANLMIHIVMAQLAAPLSVYGKEHLGLSTQQAGLIFTINGMMIVLFQYPIARWISGMRLTTALVAGSLLYAVGYSSAGLAGGFWTLAMCVVILTCGELLVAPSTLSLAANLSPSDQRGRYLGVQGFFEMIGRCLGPLLGGLALDYFADAPGNHWMIVGAIGILSACIFMGLRPRVTPAQDRGSMPAEPVRQ